MFISGPKPQRHFKQAAFLTYFTDQARSILPVIAKGLPAPEKVQGSQLSHCWDGSKDDAVRPRDLVASWGVLADQSIPTRRGLHGSGTW